MNVAIEIENALDEVEIPSKTYYLDFEKGRIVGKCDGINALRQAIHKMLITNRNAHPIIYSDDYGSDIENAVLGDTPTDDYLKTVMPRLIKDCLLIDDRITDVYDIVTTVKGENLYVECTVSSDFGELNIREVI